MRRFVCTVLILCLFLSLCACSFSQNDTGSDISFYYRRREISFHSEENVITSEPRTIAGHVGDLKYLLTLYLAGPLDEALVSPFPDNTRLFSVQQEDGRIQLILSDMDKLLTDPAFSLACACISLTCMQRADCQEVTVISGQRSITITRDNLILTDDLLPQTTEDAQ